MLACVAMPGCAFPSAQKNARAELELQLVAGKAWYRVGEPIKVLAVLTNTSSKPLELPPPDHEFLELEVRGPGLAQWTRYDTGQRRVRREKVPPGGHDIAVFDLQINRSLWWLDEPGKYELRARYRVNPYPRGDQKTPGAACRLEGGFEIRTPMAEDARRAAARIRMPDVVRFLAAPSKNGLERVEDALAEIRTTRPPATYAAYVELAIATALSQPRYDPEKKRFVHDREAALPLCRNAAGAEIDDSVLRGAGALQLAGTLAALDRRAEARKAVRGFTVEASVSKSARAAVVAWVRGEHVSAPREK